MNESRERPDLLSGAALSGHVVRRWRRLTRLLFGLAGTALCTAGFAATPSVTISSPANGATLDSMDQNKLVYAIVPGPNGDHTHLYIDGKEVAMLRQLKGTHTLETMSPGKHEICIKVVNKAHTPIGVSQCIDIAVD